MEQSQNQELSRPEFWRRRLAQGVQLPTGEGAGEVTMPTGLQAQDQVPWPHSIAPCSMAKTTQLEPALRCPSTDSASPTPKLSQGSSGRQSCLGRRSLPDDLLEEDADPGAVKSGAFHAWQQEATHMVSGTSSGMQCRAEGHVYCQGLALHVL